MFDLSQSPFGDFSINSVATQADRPGSQNCSVTFEGVSQRVVECAS